MERREGLRIRRERTVDKAFSESIRLTGIAKTIRT